MQAASHPFSTTPAGEPGDFSRPRQVGRYLVSPLIRQTENGAFSISVSIRSGSGSATTDRVLRLSGVFPCPREAVDYARAEALQWMAPADRAAAGA